MQSLVSNLHRYQAILFDMNETFMFGGGRLGPRLCENALYALDLPAESKIDRSDRPTTHDVDASNG
ncbi:hypothetical protein [Acidovorax sp. A1169]|uniref:hypothetical protein n=1 Tax=Acidovorax sp. A1169 TaxID=3059524 RepID=UPI002737C3CE|nr:hypothetical protein [Acidovorax sp. A1169]MDP4077565.1 hypothetical protein [Acidovorax sp. A1169]